jgi:hypothetical protein
MSTTGVSQFEVSDARMFDRPAAGRALFEQLIRDHLDVVRPESVSLIFDRRITSKTPGAFRTKVITNGVDPQVSCYYKSSRIKQYFKEPRALRNETMICDTRELGMPRVTRPAVLAAMKPASRWVHTRRGS